MSFFNTGIPCLPNYAGISYSSPPLSTVPLCGIFNPNRCGVFWNISGRTFYDENGNCRLDSVAVPQGNVKVQLDSAGILLQQVYTGYDGYFSFKTAPTGNYMVNADISNLPFMVNCPGSTHYADTLSLSDSLSYNNNFAFKCQAQGYDVGVQAIINTISPRPAAFINIYTLAGDMSAFYGAHCASGISGQLKLVYNGPINYIGTAGGALTPSSITGDTITWNIADFGSVNPYTAFGLVFQVDSYAIAGSPVCINVSVTPTANDYNPANNNYNYCSSVIRPLDPNEKEVYPSGGVRAGQWLTYTIRFQNTGTADAVNIYIKDTLSNYLDPSTFQLLTYSAENLTQLFANVVVFNFPNIHLPDSASSGLSTGYIQYRIKLKDNTPSFATISNRASIYFDLNPPITTNTVVNTLCGVLITDTTAYIPCGSLFMVGTNAYDTAGNFTDTLTNSQGCDSIVHLHLHINTAVVTLTQSICTNDSFNFYGTYLHNAGAYTDTLHSALGCDSIITLTLSIIPDSVNVSQAICANDSLLFYGSYYHSAGTYHRQVTSGPGCVIAATLQLSVYPLDTTTLTQSICQGDSLFFAGGYVSTAGVFSAGILNSHNCDSTVVLHLSFFPTDTVYTSRSICPGDSFYLNGGYLKTAGTYTGHQSCDTTDIIQLSFYAPDSVTVSRSICSLDSFYFNNAYLRTAGVYYEQLSDRHGCDSVVTLHLSLFTIDTVITVRSICSGDSVPFDSAYVRSTGTYTATLTGHGGCDSVAILHLSVFSADSASLSATICYGDEYDVGDSAFFYSGNYTIVIPNSHGCDSVVFLNLTVLNLDSAVLSRTLCSGDSFYYRGGYISYPGTYRFLFANATGCDSVIILTVFIITDSTTYLTHSICAGDSFQFFGQSLTTAGIYADTLSNIFGCDSAISLTLSVNPSPVVSFSWDSLVNLQQVFGFPTHDTVYCYQTGSPVIMQLYGGYPPGGVYTGLGVTNNIFDGTVAFGTSTSAVLDTVYYTYQNGYGCPGIAKGAIVVTICEGIFETGADKAITIYPNPATDELFIKAEGIIPETTIIYDVSGQKLSEGKFAPHLNISQLSSGVYFIEIKAGNQPPNPRRGNEEGISSFVARKRFIKM